MNRVSQNSAKICLIDETYVTKFECARLSCFLITVNYLMFRAKKLLYVIGIMVKIRMSTRKTLAKYYSKDTGLSNLYIYLIIFETLCKRLLAFT